MNAAHFHLVINHFPVVLMLAATAIGIHAWVRKSSEARGIALAITIAASLFALPTYFSGEPAADFLENAAIVNDMHIEEHEEAAETAVVVTTLTGICAAIAFVLSMRQSPYANRTFAVTVGMTLVSTGVLGWTGSRGGVIRHPEVTEQVTAGPDGMRATGEGENTNSDIEDTDDSQDVETEFETTPGNGTTGP